MRTPAIALVAVALSSCAAMLPAPNPMPADRYPLEGEKTARCLLVMLPGRGDRSADFASRGFIESLRQRGLSVDAVAPDATLGYYARRTLIERLREDVVGPAKRRGYEQVWILGISMGGLGSLLYAKNEPGFSGIVLMAPFLGDEEVIEEIAKAGGPLAWRPGEIEAEDYQRDLWRWLQGVLRDGAPPITLAYGTGDRMAAGHRLLASALAPGRVFAVDGGHDWETWKKLWDGLLDRSDFSRACAAPSP